MRFLGARNNTKAKDEINQEAYFGREIIIEENEGPTGLLASVEGSKPIGGRP